MWLKLSWTGLEEPQTAAGPHVARWRPDTNQTAIDPNDGLYAAPATLGTVDRGISVISVKTQSVAKEMPFPGIGFSATGKQTSLAAGARPIKTAGARPIK